MKPVGAMRGIGRFLALTPFRHRVAVEAIRFGQLPVAHRRGLCLELRTESGRGSCILRYIITLDIDSKDASTPMSVKNALQFIVRLRADEALRKQLVFSGEVPELESFVRLGDKIGLSFIVEELRTAHKHDWGMRYTSCSRSTSPSESRSQSTTMD